MIDGDDENPVKIISVETSGNPDPKLIEQKLIFTNKEAKFTGLIKSGEQKIAVGVDEVVKFNTMDEWGTLTPGSVSFKYYLNRAFYVYDKVTLTQNYKGGVELTKTDDAGTPLAGAQYSIYKDGVAVRTGLTTGADGKVIADDLVQGTYTFKETQAPDGYLIDAKEVSFEIENKFATLGGGASEVTETDGTVTKAGAGEVFIVGGDLGDKQNITLTSKEAMPEATVTVTYERLTDAVNTDLVRTFTSIADAEADVNAEKKANTITGAVSIDVKYTNPIITDRVAVNHSDKQIAAITVAGTKTWIDKAGMTGKHPDITINLLKDGVKVDSRVLKDGETTYEFKDLPSTTSNGTPYVYTVEEE